MKKQAVTLLRTGYRALFIAICGVFSLHADAQPNRQIGGVEYETESEGLSASEIQDKTIEYFSKIASAMDGDSIPAVESLSQNQITYLNSVYLYCTVNKGVCALPLEALLELDLMSSKSKNAAACPILTQFWTQWLKDKFEDRQQYNVKTSNISATTEFTSMGRPKFIKCKGTIEDLLAGSEGSSSWFKKRYGPSGEGRDRISKFVELLKLIRERKINVIGEQKEDAPDLK